MGVELEDRAQAAESIRRITDALSVKCKYRYAGRGQTGGVELEERAQAAESIKRITAALSVKCKYR